MTDREKQTTPTTFGGFFNIEARYRDPATAGVHIVQIPYDGATSYGKGAALAPQAVIDASQHVELYDEITRSEPYKAGIATLSALQLPEDPAAMFRALYTEMQARLSKDGARVVAIGGDHSVTVPHIKALSEIHHPLSVIQLDAHADLRDSYQDTPLSHGCVMRRIREYTPHTLQLGIRSLSREEADYIAAEGLAVGMMHDCRSGTFDLAPALAALPDPVFVTLDVDVLDTSVIATTGTPEPGGFTWYQMHDVLTSIFTSKHVIGFDIVELAGGRSSRSSAFAVARLLYRMIGLMLD